MVFADEVEISMIADMRTSRLSANVAHEAGYNVLKSIAVYGQNNVGKTCLLKCIRAIINVMSGELGSGLLVRSNYFKRRSKISEMEIEFIQDGEVYTFGFSYDGKNKEFISEHFYSTTRDSSGSTSQKVLFRRDTVSGTYESTDASLAEIMKIASKNNILVYTLESKQFRVLYKAKSVMQKFADRVDIVHMHNIDYLNTIGMLRDPHYRNVMKAFARSADIYLDDIVFSEDLGEVISIYQEHALASKYEDSTGTQKMIAVASYVIDAIDNGRILLIDEIDSSLHFRLTRAIVALFNNDENEHGQLIFNTHDISLLDLKRLFRKEQIWFVDKDVAGANLYSLSDYTARDGVRETSDIEEMYKRGDFGALPEPDLIDALLSTEKSGEADD
jgi:AAA15 family ATPase/GTPase